MTEGFESGLVKDAKGTWAQYLERVGPSFRAASAAFGEFGKAVADAYIGAFSKWYTSLQRADLARRLNKFSVFGLHLPYWRCKWIADRWPTRWLPAVGWGDDNEEDDE